MASLNPPELELESLPLRCRPRGVEEPRGVGVVIPGDLDSGDVDGKAWLWEWVCECRCEDAAADTEVEGWLEEGDVVLDVEAVAFDAIDLGFDGFVDVVGEVEVVTCVDADAESEVVPGDGVEGVEGF